MMAQPLIIRKLGREQVGHLRQISRRRVPIRFHWLGREWSVRFSMLNNDREGLSEISLDWGGAHAKFRSDESWLAQITHAALGIDDECILRGDWRMVAFEAAFSELSLLIERSTRKRFVLKDNQDKSGIVQWEKFSVEFYSGGQVSTSEIWLDYLGIGFLSNALQEIPVACSESFFWNELPIKVRFLVGETKITYSTLTSLARRDVLIIEDSYLGENLNELSVKFGEKYSAIGTMDGKKITVTDVLGKSMDEIDESDVDQQEAYGELSVRLSFDLGDRVVQLSELMSIGPGYVFDLGRDVRRAVFIRANGKIIGEGELVDMDGEVGVSILNIAPIGPSEK